MNVAVPDGVIVKEIKILSVEAMQTDGRAAVNYNDSRRRMALAQLVLCVEIGRYLLDTDDWDGFSDKLAKMMEEDYCRYKEARATEDRTSASVALARFRAQQTLRRRLVDPKRRADIDFATDAG